MNSLSTASFNRPALSWNRAALYAWSAVFIAGNIALPHICHLALGAAGGRALLPVYFFTLIGAALFGRNAGVLAAFAAPLLANILSNGAMPPAVALPVIIAKGIILALLVPLALRRLALLPLAIAAAVIGYQVLGGAFEWAWTGSLDAALRDIAVGWPGLLAQFALGTALLALSTKIRNS